MMNKTWPTTMVVLVLALVWGIDYFKSPAHTTSTAQLSNTENTQAEPASTQTQPLTHSSDQRLAQAFAQQQHDVLLQGSGRVKALLKDDTQGARHQKFILLLDSGQTLLVAHNIDLAARVEHLSLGDRVQFKGDYEYSAQGGVIHWTHRDPQQRHADGWLKHDGKIYH
jgi:hypothetical protein